MTTQLIFVDGCLLGIGKSTVAQWITLALRHNQPPARWIPEYLDPHFAELGRLFACADPSDMPEAPPRPAEALVGSRVPHPPAFTSRDFAHASLQAWQSFVDSARQGPITVLDSCLFQHPLIFVFLECEDVIRSDNPDETCLIDYYDRLQAILRPLNPVLIYLCGDNTVEHMAKLRAVRGAPWVDYYTQLLLNTPYARRNNYQGDRGAVATLEPLRTANLRLCSRLTIPKLVVDVSDGNWDACYEQITHFLDLPEAKSEPAQPLEQLEQLAGIYDALASDLTCRVRFEAGQLLCDNLWEAAPESFSLISIAPYHFVTRGAPFELSFERCQAKADWQLRIGDGDWDRSGLVLLKRACS